MTMILKRSVFLLVMVLFAPLVAHSQITIQVSGGGWISGANGGKATFNVDVFPNGTGTFAYQDKAFRSSDFPRGVNIQGVITFAGFSSPGVVNSSGTYTAAQGGRSGYFTATFTDTGAKGPQKGDSVQISLCLDQACTVPLYNDYSVLGAGRNGGGNITVSGAGTHALIVFGTLLLGWALWRRREAVLRARH